MVNAFVEVENTNYNNDIFFKLHGLILHLFNLVLAVFAVIPNHKMFQSVSQIFKIIISASLCCNLL